MPSSSIPPAGEVIDVLLRIALPAGIPILVLPTLLARKWGSKGFEIGLLVGAAVGLILANLRRGVLPWLPSGWGWSWFLLTWLATSLASVAFVWLGSRPYVRAVGTLAACGLAAWVLLPEGLRTSIWAFPLLAASAWVPWMYSKSQAPVADRGSGFSPRPHVPDGLILLTLALLGGSAVLLHAHSARLMDIALMAGFTLGASAMIAGWFGNDGNVLGGIPSVTLPGLMLAGWNSTSSEVPIWSFILVGLSAWPLVAFGNRELTTKLRTLRGSLVLGPVMGAVALAMRAETLEF